MYKGHLLISYLYESDVTRMNLLGKRKLKLLMTNTTNIAIKNSAVQTSMTLVFDFYDTVQILLSSVVYQTYQFAT